MDMIKCMVGDTLKNKGYTITELLAVIVILGILISIGVTAYNGIKKDTLETTYKNVTSIIETAAVKYANDTGETLTNVNTLVEQGYLKADDESGNIYDPRDNSTLNCHTISITDDGENYDAKLNNTTSCDLTENKIVNITCNPDNTKESCINWTNSDKTLTANLTTNDYLDASKYKIEYVWLSNTGASSLDKTIMTSIFDGNILNTQYKVTVNIVDVITQEIIKTATDATMVKIDKQGPTIVDVKQDGSNFTINASDLNGIGLNDNGYGMGATCQNNLNNVIGQNNLEGKVKVCATDKLGNVGSMDITIPTLNIATSDNVATGIIHTNPYSLTFKGSEDTTKIYYGTTENNLDKEVSGTSVVINNITDNNTYYAKVCSEKYCSPVKSYKSLYGVLATASVSQFESSDSTYNGSINVGNNVLAIKSIKVTSPYGGSASVISINGSIINYQVSGGNQQSSLEYGTYYQGASITDTQSNCSYYCSSGYLSGDMCYYGSTTVGGSCWWSCSGIPSGGRGGMSCTNNGCPSGYSKDGYSCSGSVCPSTSESCTNYCSRGPSSASLSCSSYCSSGTQIGNNCYSCSNGVLEGTQCLVTYPYTRNFYKYALSIEYYK